MSRVGSSVHEMHHRAWIQHINKERATLRESTLRADHQKTWSVGFRRSSSSSKLSSRSQSSSNSQGRPMSAPSPGGVVSALQWGDTRLGASFAGGDTRRDVHGAGVLPLRRDSDGGLHQPRKRQGARSRMSKSMPNLTATLHHSLHPAAPEAYMGRRVSGDSPWGSSSLVRCQAAMPFPGPQHLAAVRDVACISPKHATAPSSPTFDHRGKYSTQHPSPCTNGWWMREVSTAKRGSAAD